MELSTSNAGKLIGVSHQTIHNHIRRGLLPAQRVGFRQAVKIKVEDLRKFAEEYNYRFDEALYQQMVQDEEE